MSRSWIILACIFSVLCMQAECWSYGRSDRKMSWDRARAWCKRHYTDLVTMKNQEEMDHLKMWMTRRENDSWIGIRKIDDNWKHVATNEPVSEKTQKTNWMVGVAQDSDCVVAVYSRSQHFGKWFDLPCNAIYPYALCYAASCQRDSCVHGECVEKVNGHRCECYAGYDGDKCQHAVQCEAPPKLAHGAVIYGQDPATRFSDGSNYTVICEEGYRMVGPDSVTCMWYGQWSAPPQCQAVQCPAPPPLANGAVSYGDDPATRFSYGNKCTFICQPGYRMVGPDSATCTSAARWSPMPRCEAVECSELTPPPKGDVSCAGKNGDFAFDSQCRYCCDEGYELSHPQPLTCTATKNWSHLPPTCEAVQCPAPPRLANGAVRYGDDPATRFSYGNKCTFICQPGYRMVGPDSATCTSAGRWSPMPRCEEIQCPAPEAPQNGNVTCTSSLLPPQSRFPCNSVCTFSCRDGYVLQGAVSVTCTDFGQWTFAPPTCQAVQCDAPPPLPNGVVRYGDDPATRFSYGNKCTFICQRGYRMVGPDSATCTSAGRWSPMPRCEATSTVSPVHEGSDIA